MAKKHTKQILTEEQHERFDLLMDSNLQNAVHKEITGSGEIVRGWTTTPSQIL